MKMLKICFVVIALFSLCSIVEASSITIKQPVDVLGTPQTTTSGTSSTITGISAGTKQIIILLSGVSTNGLSPIIIRIGPSGGVENSGYSGSVSSAAGVGALMSTGFHLSIAVTALSVIHGRVVLNLLNSSTNTWACSSIIGLSNGAAVHVGGGTKSLAGVLERVSMTTVGGVNTFDAGSINILRR